MPEEKLQSIARVEHDGSSVPTKRVLLYGWDGSQKVRVQVSAAGVVATSASIDTSSPFTVVQASASSLRASVVNEASTNLIGGVFNRPDVANLTASLANITPKFAVINVAASGDTALIAGVSNKQILVLQYALVVGTNGDQVIFKDGIAGNAVTGPMRFSANGGIAAPYSPVGLFRSASGASLVLNSSLGSQISGHLVYVEV